MILPISFKHSVGTVTSTCRNQRISPRAACAPAFSCAARPAVACTTQRHNAVASSAVWSVLPPSATIISAFPARSRKCVRNGWIKSASFNVGTIMEIVMTFGVRLDIQRLINLALSRLRMNIIPLLDYVGTTVIVCLFLVLLLQQWRFPSFFCAASCSSKLNCVNSPHVVLR